MQMYHMLPTVPLTNNETLLHMLPTVLLTNNETLLQRVTRSMTTWRRTAIAHIPTQMLSLELFASTDDAEYAYDTAFAIQATELVLLHE
jgi:hypothetical protein